MVNRSSVGGKYGPLSALYMKQTSAIIPTSCGVTQTKSGRLCHSRQETPTAPDGAIEVTKIDERFAHYHNARDPPYTQSVST